LPEGKKIVQVEYSNGESTAFISEKKGVSLPVVVLTNEGSASASEILAAAIKAHGGATIGKKTFGKGTVQNSVEMADKSQIKLTVARWLTPTGEWIHEKGVTPTVDVDQPPYFHVTQLPADKTLKIDMNSDDVKSLQLMLKGLGFNPGREDGYFDKQTETAVKSFQHIHHLPVTGQVDVKTAAKLQELILEKIEDPKNDLQLQAALQYLAKQSN
jgi:carboxyl-terminal processing protease